MLWGQRVMIYFMSCSATCDIKPEREESKRQKELIRTWWKERYRLVLSNTKEETEEKV